MEILGLGDIKGDLWSIEEIKRSLFIVILVNGFYDNLVVCIESS